MPPPPASDLTRESAPTDEALMAAAADGHRMALDALYRRHADGLRRYLVRFESAEASADDLVQETFVRVIRYAASFDPGRSFRGWVYRIARNVGVASLPAGLPGEALDDVQLAAADDPHREYQVRAALDALAAAVEALPQPDRQVIVLARIEGRSYREVARILGCTEGAVKLRVFRALRRLRARLAEASNPGGWLDEL